MAVLKYNPQTGKIEGNDHYMSGKPDTAEYFDDFTAEVEEGKAAGIKNILSKLYPHISPDDIKVLGTPWDYKLSTSPDHRDEKLFGHYRVQVGDMPQAVLCVNKNDGNEAITIGGEYFEVCEAEGIDTLGPLSLPSGQFTAEIEGAYVHLEQFRPGAKTLFNTKLNGRQKEIGELVGAITNVGANLAKTNPDLDLRLKQYSTDTTLRCVERGLEIIQRDGGLFDEIKKVLGSKKEELGLEDAELTALFNELSQIIKTEVPRIARDPNRVATTFNMIEKMVIDNPDGSFAYKSYDTPVRGHLAMFTDNATHDAGFAVGRIISDPKLYNGSDEEIKKQVVDGLHEYCEAYNTTTGKSLTAKEAVRAAILVNAFNLVQGLGYNDLSGGKNPQTNEDLAAHIVTNTVPEFMRLRELSAQIG